MESEYQFLINTQESTGLKHLNDSKVFIEYWHDMDDIIKKLKNTIQMKNANYWLLLFKVLLLIC